MAGQCRLTCRDNPCHGANIGLPGSPDGEVLTYGYDSGGNLTQAQGVKGNYTYGYLNKLTYDKFEQRSTLESGNGINAQYRYDPRNRRLANLATGDQGVSVVENDVNRNATVSVARVERVSTA